MLNKMTTVSTTIKILGEVDNPDNFYQVVRTFGENLHEYNGLNHFVVKVFQSTTNSHDHCYDFFSDYNKPNERQIVVMTGINQMKFSITPSVTLSRESLADLA